VGLIWWLAALSGGLLSVVLSDLVSDEVRARLDRLPHALLRWARRRLPTELRERVHDQEWLPELDYILHRAEKLPVTRLISGTRYALGLVIRATAIGDELLPHHQPDRQDPGQPRGLADRGLKALRSAWPGPEPLWVRAYWTGIMAGAVAAICVAGVSTTFRVNSFAAFLILVAAGRLVEPIGQASNRPGPVAWRSFWFWSLSVAAVLPPVYALVAPIPLTVLTLRRSANRVPPYRLLFSAACQGLACGCISMLFRAATRAAPRHIIPGSGPLQWVIALIICSVLGWAILDALVMAAIKGSNPAVEALRMVIGRAAMRHDITEIFLGVMIAFTIYANPLVAMMSGLPAAVLLHRWLHHSCVCSQQNLV
jgi:hypothetical protein